MDPLLFRGIERLIIAIGAIVFAYLGYRLYLFGIDKGNSKLAAESDFYKFVLSGTGPGLFFMAFGGVILMTALFTGKITKNKDFEIVSPFAIETSDGYIIEFSEKGIHLNESKGQKTGRPENRVRTKEQMERFRLIESLRIGDQVKEPK